MLQHMKLSIIMPVYNEKATLEEILKKVTSIPIHKEIIVVDDGSTDGTREILQNLRMKNLNVIYHPKNLGKGSAIRTGIRYVTGDIVLIQDADLEYNPEEYPKLIEPIVTGKTRVVYGSRYLNKEFKKSYQSFYWGVRLISWVANVLYGVQVTDEATCYKIFQTDVLKGLNLRCKRFEFCPEVTAKLGKKGISIYEVPISYNPRKREDGKKISWRDGLQAVWILIKYRFLD